MLKKIFQIVFTLTKPYDKKTEALEFQIFCSF